MSNRRFKWFWHEDEKHLLLSKQELLDCYYKSVGRNSNLLIGMVIDDRGLVPNTDIKQLQTFGQAIKKRFNRIKGEITGQGNELTLDFVTPTGIDQIMIMEELAKGECIRAYELLGFIYGH